MKISRELLLVLLLILASLAVGLFFYPQMPERMASHWNAQGQVDGYMSRFWGIFFMPILTAGLALLLLLVPRIDPLKSNIEKFKSTYYLFVAIVLGFMLYIYLLTIFANLGYRFNMVRLMLPAFAALFYYCGVLVGKARRNYFIGIRTPWTLNNDRVWEKTHALGGILFKITAIASLLGVFFTDFAIWFMLIPALLTAVITVVYSYVMYRQEVKAP